MKAYYLVSPFDREFVFIPFVLLSSLSASRGSDGVVSRYD